MDTADCILSRDRALRPKPQFVSVSPCCFNQFHFDVVGVAKPQNRLPETRTWVLRRNTSVLQSRFPPFVGAGRDRKSNRCGRARTCFSWRSARPRKEGQNGTWATHKVAIIKVVGAGVVKVDGPLYQTQAQDRGVEGDVRLSVTRNRRDMMNTANAGHKLIGIRWNPLLDASGLKRTRRRHPDRFRSRGQGSRLCEGCFCALY